MEWFEKIRERRKALTLSQVELAEQTGVSQAAIWKIENGKTKNSRFTPMLAARLNIPLSELIEGLPPEGVTDPIVAKGAEVMRMPFIAETAYGFGGEIPVFAATEAGPGELTIGTQKIGNTRRPAILEGIPNGFAVYVVGESMEPEYEAGDTAYIHPRLPPVPNTTCIFYGDDAGQTQRSTIKRLTKITTTDWHVRQWNPPPGQKPEFKLKKADWPVAWRVVGKISRG